MEVKEYYDIRFLIAEIRDIKSFSYSQFPSFQIYVKGFSKEDIFYWILHRNSHIKDQSLEGKDFYCIVELTKAQLTDLALNPMRYRELRPQMSRKTNRTFEYPWRYKDFKTMSIKEFLDKYND